jgi:hypothetical protein
MRRAFQIVSKSVRQGQRSILVLVLVLVVLMGLVAA